MRTRLESQVERGITRPFASFFESQHFGMFHTGPGVRAASDHHVITHNYGAHGRIRAHPAKALGGKIERLFEIAVHAVVAGAALLN
jgi:hypothetical protein